MKNITVLQTPHDECTGCAACMNCCPVGAIAMKPDKEGFLCPAIDEKKCISCGKCAKICPILQEKKDINSFEPQCYAAWSKDDNIRFQSASGGVFTHLAETVIDDGGTVVGARYRSDHLAEHALIREKEEIEQFRQSKYVQSDIGFVFLQVQNELKNGKPLLFSGTPCQCGGLRSYLEKDYENLYLCDFICHGVNSPLVYLKYLNELEEKYGSKVKQVWFKNKTFGWNNYITKITFEDGQKYTKDRDADPFMFGFIKRRTNLYMRESCYQCHFKEISRPVDITLADFWGVEKTFPDIDTSNGVSAVLVHSEKGKSFFEKNDSIAFRQCDLHSILDSNKSMIESAFSLSNKEAFWEDFFKGKSFFDIIDSYK